MKKIVVLLLTFLCMGAPVVLYAQNKSSTPVGSLRFGMRGKQVTLLQEALNKTGCKIASTKENGYFGQATKAAVICFQKQNGFVADGVVGPMTRIKLGLVK